MLPMSFAAMQDKFGNINISKPEVGSYDQAIGGSPEALNEFLDFTVQKIPDSGLNSLTFN